MIELLDETTPENSNDDLPVRSLDKFTFYDERSGEPTVPPSNYDIERSRGTFFASGIVKAIRESGDSDSDSEPIHKDEKISVKLGLMQELWYGTLSDGSK